MSLWQVDGHGPTPGSRAHAHGLDQDVFTLADRDLELVLPRCDGKEPALRAVGVALTWFDPTGRTVIIRWRGITGRARAGRTRSKVFSQGRIWNSTPGRR